jgi:hypothetical protein
LPLEPIFWQMTHERSHVVERVQRPHIGDNEWSWQRAPPIRADTHTKC